MIHLYFGDGKGKTTAAIGLALRALGNGWRVFFVQFMKNAPAGEIASLEKMGATILRGKAGNHFFSDMTEDEKVRTREISSENLSRALSLCGEENCGAPSSCEETLSHTEQPDAAGRAGQKTLLVLDEICAAYQYDLIDRAAVDFLVHNPPARTELVLTGRNPPPVFLECADYITEMKKIRHPYDTGIPARRGVEF